MRKRSDEVLMMVAMYSPDGSLTPTEVADYALLNVVDYLKRLPGIGDVNIFGNTESAMRIWLDPQRMARMGVTVQDVEDTVSDKKYGTRCGYHRRHADKLPRNSSTTPRKVPAVV
mgnify:CR=1 FL=1